MARGPIAQRGNAYFHKKDYDSAIADYGRGDPALV